MSDREYLNHAINYLIDYKALIQADLKSFSPKKDIDRKLIFLSEMKIKSLKDTIKKLENIRKYGISD